MFDHIFIPGEANPLHRPIVVTVDADVSAFIARTKKFSFILEIGNFIIFQVNLSIGL